MPISDFLEPEQVIVDVDVRSKKRALERLSELLADGQDNITSGQVFDALCQRERLGCTSLGRGVALPHARIDGLESVVAAFIRLRDPISYDSNDGEDISMIFGMIVPEEDVEPHSYDLSEIASLFIDSDLRDQLQDVDDASDAYTALVDARLPPPPRELEASG